MRRWSEHEDIVLKRMYAAGTQIKLICEELERERSSVCARLNLLAARGELERNRGNKNNFIRHGDKLLKFYISQELFKKLSTRARIKGKTVSAEVRTILTQMLM